MTDIRSPQHPTLYFPDGDLLLPFPSTTFRVHRARLLPALGPSSPIASSASASLPTSSLSSPSAPDPPPSSQDVAIVHIADIVSAHDFAALAAHIYHNAPPSIAVLRASAPSALDAPTAYVRALVELAARFPAPVETVWMTIPIAEEEDEGLEEALELAMSGAVPVGKETKKTLLYRVATATNFDPTGAHDPSLPSSTTTTTAPPPSTPDASRSAPLPILAAAHPALSTRTLRICHRVLSSLIARFTPTLFTVGAAQHMACTDVLAERWMPDVIAPALADGGVGRPLEALARVRGIVSERWVKEGVCAECEAWLRAEYEAEGRAIWDELSGWVDDAERAEDTGA